MGTLEELAPEEGDEPQHRYGRSKSKPTKKDKKPKQDTTTGDQPQSRGQKNVRPEEVSERTWGLAEQWLEMGLGHFGKRPPVNKQEFSKRLDAKIKGDPNLTKWLKMKPEFWADTGKWDNGGDFVNDVVSKMIDLFYKYLIANQTNTSALQFDFLNDEWDEWAYQAETAVRMDWNREHGTWVTSSLPSAVFNPASVGKPNPEDPCTDPTYPAGITWAEAWALDDEWLQDHPLEERDDEVPDTDYRASEGFARLAAAMLANRDRRRTTTSNEENDQ